MLPRTFLLNSYFPFSSTGPLLDCLLPFFRLIENDRYQCCGKDHDLAQVMKNNPIDCNWIILHYSRQVMIGKSVNHCCILLLTGFFALSLGDLF
jgi:hypothetical protein